MRVVSGTGFKAMGTLVAAALVAGCVSTGGRGNLPALQRLAERDPGPFVLVENAQGGTTSRGQGVLISSRGHVLTAGHISWHETLKGHGDKFLINLRTRGVNVPKGAAHHHKTTFLDKERTVFHEHRYPAALLKQGDSRFFGNRDLSVLKIAAKAAFPKIDFFSTEEPELAAGDVLHLCHYHWPHKPAEPTFFINPVEVVGVVQTSSGLQYLATGYYRWGSSGGAILKDGRLVGIQSAAYTVNAKDIGEMPMGLISFQVVYRSMFDDLAD